jgi:hypothetical protein
VTERPADRGPAEPGEVDRSGAHPPDASPPSPDGAADEQHDRSVVWLADYVYGTISTLVAIAGLTYENKPDALINAGLVVAAAVAIWLAHGASRLVIHRTWQSLELHASDVRRVLQSSWTIVVAAVPGTFVFLLAGLHVWTVRAAFVLAEIVGVLALAVVGYGTTRGQGRRLGRRLLYIGGLVMVGVVIVLLELLVHLL